MSDKDRARILAEYEVLDSLPEKEFDDIVELASAICGTPISAISLLDLDRQWFKAQVGLDTDQTPLDQSFCRYAAHNPEDVMVINDSLNDDRFKNNPLTLGDPHIRFYAGAPLVTEDGVALGALCVIDRQPREFTDVERRMLQILAKRVMKLLDMRRENLRQKKIIRDTTKQLDRTLNRLLEAQSVGHIGNWDWNMRTGEIYWSPQMYELMDPHPKPDSINDNTYFDRILHPDDLPLYLASMEQLRRDHQPCTVEFRIIKGAKETWLLMRSEVRLAENGQIDRIYGIMQDISERKKAEKDHQNYLQTLEAMLFDVSHKIRRPLTTLLGLIPVLKESENSPADFMQATEYLFISLHELEGYTRELNDLIHKSKTDILDSKN